MPKLVVPTVLLTPLVTGWQDGGGDPGLVEKLMVAFKYISAELDSAAAQERIIQECCTLLKCDRSSLFLIDSVSGDLELSLGKGMSRAVIPKGKGIAGHVALTGEVLHVSDPYRDPRFNKQADKESGYVTKSILCAPVRDSDGRSIAVLEAINKLDGAFSEQDTLILEKLAMLAGIALHNAQLVEDSKASLGVDAPPSNAAHRAGPTPAPAGGDGSGSQADIRRLQDQVGTLTSLVGDMDAKLDRLLRAHEAERAAAPRRLRAPLRAPPTPRGHVEEEV